MGRRKEVHNIPDIPAELLKCLDLNDAVFQDPVGYLLAAAMIMPFTYNKEPQSLISDLTNILISRKKRLKQLEVITGTDIYKSVGCLGVFCRFCF